MCDELEERTENIFSQCDALIPWDESLVIEIFLFKKLKRLIANGALQDRPTPHLHLKN